MDMSGAGMRNGLAGMAVGVDVNRAVTVAVPVKMHAIAPQPPQHMGAETDQHDADGGLDRARELLGDRVPEQDRRTGKDEQCQGVAEAPGQAVPDDVADVGAARGDRGHRRDMVGLERVLHAEQKSKPQNSEHVSPVLSFPSLRGAKRRSNPFFL